jgi:hypothetical protein
MGADMVLGPILNLLSKVLGKTFGQRPEMEVWPERVLRGRRVFMCLRVHNPLPHKVHILSITVQPELFEVWMNSSVEAAASAQEGVSPQFILEQGGTKLLPLLAIDRRNDGIAETARITLWWRSHRHPRRPKLPVWLELTHGDYDRIQKAG